MSRNFSETALLAGDQGSTKKYGGTSSDAFTVVKIPEPAQNRLQDALKAVLDEKKITALAKPWGKTSWAEKYAATTTRDTIRVALAYELLYFLFAYESTARALEKFGIDNPRTNTAIDLTLTVPDTAIGLVLVAPEGEMVGSLNRTVDKETGNYIVKLNWSQIVQTLDWNKIKNAVTDKFSSAETLHNISTDQLKKLMTEVFDDNFTQLITSRHEKNEEDGVKTKKQYTIIPEQFILGSASRLSRALPFQSPLKMASHILDIIYNNKLRTLAWALIIWGYVPGAYADVEAILALAEPHARENMNLPGFLFDFAELATATELRKIMLSLAVTVPGMFYYFFSYREGVAAELGPMNPAKATDKNATKYKGELWGFFKENKNGIALLVFIQILFSSIGRGLAFDGMAQKQWTSLSGIGSFCALLGAGLGNALARGPRFIAPYLAPHTGPRGEDAPITQLERDAAYRKLGRLRQGWLILKSSLTPMMYSLVILLPLMMIASKKHFLEGEVTYLDFLIEWITPAVLVTAYFLSVPGVIFRGDFNRHLNTLAYEKKYNEPLIKKNEFELGRVALLMAYILSLDAQSGRLLTNFLFGSEAFPFNKLGFAALPISVMFSIPSFAVNVAFFVGQSQKGIRAFIDLVKHTLIGVPTPEQSANAARTNGTDVSPAGSLNGDASDGFPSLPNKHDTEARGSGLYLYGSFLRHCEGKEFGSKLFRDVTALPIGFLKLLAGLLKLLTLDLGVFVAQSTVMATYALSVLTCLPFVALYDAGTTLCTGLTHAGTTLWNGDCQMPSCNLPSSLSGLFGGTARPEKDSEEMPMSEIASEVY